MQTFGLWNATQWRSHLKMSHPQALPLHAKCMTFKPPEKHMYDLWTPWEAQRFYVKIVHGEGEPGNEANDKYVRKLLLKPCHNRETQTVQKGSSCGVN